MPSRVNRLLCEGIEKDYGSLTNTVVVCNRGLSGEQAAEVRRELRGQKLRMRVVRNRLTKQAFKKSSPADFSKLFVGPTVFIQGDDPVQAARTAVQFAKKYEKLQLVGALLDGQMLDADGVKELAKSPSRKQLHSMIVSMAMAPGRALGAILLSPGEKIAGTVRALVEKLEKAGEGSGPGAGASPAPAEAKEGAASKPA